MGWGWKLVCAILYMLPWTDVTEKTVYFLERFPTFAWAEYFTEPFEHWFYIHEWAPLIIFFGTYLGIVRNKKISHVARYHVMMVRACVVFPPASVDPSGFFSERLLSSFCSVARHPNHDLNQPAAKTSRTNKQTNKNRASCSTSSP